MVVSSVGTTFTFAAWLRSARERSSRWRNRGRSTPAAATIYTRLVLPPAIAERLRRTLEAGPPLRLAVLFGSSARTRQHPESDLDVGIVPCDPDLPLIAELDLQVGLEHESGRRVDLVRLDRASTLLRWEAARHGIVILAEPPREHARFVADAALEHAEFALVFGPAAERFRQRLLEPLPTSPTAA
jgi:predicted nucleotidyltransferase